MRDFNNETMVEYDTEFIAKNTIVVFTFPLPSPTNYALLANLTTILSYVYHRVIIVTGSFTKHLPFIVNELRLASKESIYVYDLGYKMPQRSSKVSLFKKFFIYTKIHICLIVAILKIRSAFKVALLFIGIPHMLPLILILKLMKKRIIIY